MISVPRLLASALVLAVTVSTVPQLAWAKNHNAGFKVLSAGGSLDETKGDLLQVQIQPKQITITQIKIVHDNPQYASWVHRETKVLAQIDPAKVTDITYGSEAHHRVGAGIAVGVVSLGAGLIVASTKAKKHFIGFNWDQDGQKTGVALEVEKKDYKALIAQLQQATGKQAVDTDPTEAKKLGVK